MATVKDTLWKSLLNFPTIFPNALSVYNHLFCVMGNGYEWVDGELVELKCDDPEINKFFKSDNINDAIINFLEYELIHLWNEDGPSRRFLYKSNDSDEAIAKYVTKINKRVIECTKMIMDTENRMNDFTIPVDIIHKDKIKFSFYPLSEYSKICNLPDDIKDDWLEAAIHIYNIMKENEDLVNDSDGLMDKIGQRLEELNKRKLC